MRSARRILSTIRVRTTLTACAVVAVALLVGAVALVGILHHAMVNSVDSQIGLRADDLAATTSSGGLPQRLAGGIHDDTVAQAIAGNGRVIAQSMGIRGTRPIAPIPSTLSGDTIRTIDHPPIGDGAAYRVLMRRIRGPQGPMVLLVGGSLERTRDSINTVTAVLAVGIPALVLLVGALAWWMVSNTLEPVELIRREVAEISNQALDRRIPEPRTVDEIRRLAQTMNDMLERLEAARRHEQRFVADAAHELRSPLTNIRTQLEVALAHPETTDWAELSASLLDQHERIGTLVEDLLILARADDRKLGVARQDVDLDEIVLAAAEPIRARGRVQLDLSGLTAARVAGAPGELARVVQNLLANAERHAASSVRIAIRPNGDSVELLVDDDGPGIPLEDRQRVFDRFTRLDDDRSRTGGGAGLGLAIVKEIVLAHHGTVQITAPPYQAHGTRVRVTLPTLAPSFPPTLVPG